MYHVGDTLVYVGPRPEKDVPSWMKDPLSFRRYLERAASGTVYIEVFTSSGSMNMDVRHVAEATSAVKIFLEMERGIRDLGAYAAGLMIDRRDHPSHRTRLRDINNATREFWGAVKVYQYTRLQRTQTWQIVEDDFYDSRTAQMAATIREFTSQVH